MRQLEEGVGAPLFLRVNKKLYLTEAGRALLGHAETIIRAHDDAKADLAALGGPSRGQLRLGVASTAITAHPLPEILSEIKRKNAPLDLSVAGVPARGSSTDSRGSIDVGLVISVDASILTETPRSVAFVAAQSPSPQAGLAE
jgi:DNA-binding transcriptional LysR family regulator